MKSSTAADDVEQLQLPAGGLTVFEEIRAAG